MPGDLPGGPAPGRQHADGELRGGQVVGHIVAGDGVVNSTPAGRETVGDVDNSLKILRPVGLDGRLQHGPQQSVVFPEGFDEIVRPGDLPGGQQMGLGLFRRLETHVVHHRHQMQVDGGDGVGGRSHGKGSLHHPGAVGVVLLQIEIVGLHIQGKGPQPGGQQGQKGFRRRHFLRQRQVQQHRRRKGHKGLHGAGRRVGLPAGSQGAPDLTQGAAGVVDPSHGQAGIGEKQTGGKTNPAVSRRKITFRFLHGLFRLPAEIVVLRQGNVLFRTGFHAGDGLFAAPGTKRGVHQGHEAGKQLRRLLRAWGSGLRFLFAGVAGLFGARGNGPGSAEPLRAGDAALGTILIDSAL